MTRMEIKAAMEKVGDRKLAALPELEHDPVALSDVQRLRLMLSGTDLDAEEVMEQSGRVQQVGFLAVLVGAGGPGAIAAAMWIDGLMVGQEVERARHDQPAEAPNRGSVASHLGEVLQEAGVGIEEAMKIGAWYAEAETRAKFGR